MVKIVEAKRSTMKRGAIILIDLGSRIQRSWERKSSRRAYRDLAKPATAACGVARQVWRSPTILDLFKLGTCFSQNLEKHSKVISYSKLVSKPSWAIYTARK
jgi:hypothetical protein